MTMLTSSSREVQPPPSRLRFLKVALPALLCVLLLAVVGTILAGSGPSPEKRDNLSEALAASALDLTAGDPLHNQAIQALMVTLEKDGYQINGAKPISEDCWSVLRGRQSVFSPHDNRVAMEWRLAVCAHPQGKPHSYLALRLPDQPFTAGLTKTLEEEWLHYAKPLPKEVIAAAQELLAKLPEYHQQDRAATAPCQIPSTDAAVVLREWRGAGIESPDDSSRYYLRLRQLTERYEVAVELHNEQDGAGNAGECWLCIDFIRLGQKTAAK